MAEDVLSDLERQILAIKLAEPGITNGEIGARVGRTRQIISGLVNRDPLRRAIDESLNDAVSAAREELIAGSVKAARKLVHLVDHGETDHIKRLAARDVILILQRREDDADVGDEEWEFSVAKSGAVSQTKRKQIEAGDGGGADGEPET